MDRPPAFGAAIAEAYQTHLVPIMFRPWAELVAGRAASLAPGRVLELAAGTGAGTRALRAALPSADIVATDLSEDMLDQARQAGGNDGVVWQQADAQSLPFAADSADVAVMLFGIMFVPDRAAAYRELRRVLRPGGTLFLTSWDAEDVSPHVVALVRGAAELAPDSPPVDLPRLAHGYHDAECISAELRSAGFERVDVRRVSPTAATTARDVAQGYALGSPLAAELDRRGIGPERRIAGLEAAFTSTLGSPSFDLPLPGLLTTVQ